MQRIAPGVAVGMLVRDDVQMRQIGEGGAAELDIDPALRRTATVRLLATSNRQRAGTIAPSSITWSNSARIESVVSSL
jgi:hypothetical protein